MICIDRRLFVIFILFKKKLYFVVGMLIYLIIGVVLDFRGFVRVEILYRFFKI